MDYNGGMVLLLCLVGMDVWLVVEPTPLKNDGVRQLG